MIELPRGTIICPRCDGKGEYEFKGGKCPYCGQGKVPCPDCTDGKGNVRPRAEAEDGQVPNVAELWDLTVPARKIVYVVDYSGSIIVAVDDLKEELKRSIGKLKPPQSFTVILFYSTPAGLKSESFKPKLEPASEESRREFFPWIDRKAPQGDTEPVEAMGLALALHPDAVFFLSDGLFEDSVVTELARLNSKAHTRIYCLVFDEIYLRDTSGQPPAEKEGSRRMRNIAEANAGKVKIVTGKNLTP